jgi:hypothetical protein
MDGDSKKTAPETGEPKSRRAIVKTAAQVAVTAPAVALLLSATTKSARALPYGGLPIPSDGPNGDGVD